MAGAKQPFFNLKLHDFFKIKNDQVNQKNEGMKMRDV
jgi:hypothetical protein